MIYNKGEVKAANPRPEWTRDLKVNWQIYVLFIPVFLYFFIFNYLPIGGVLMAFQDFRPVRGILGSDWVGLENFIDFFTNPSFLIILRNTIVISTLGLVIAFPLTIMYALLLNEINIKSFKRVTQTISYMPHFISMVVVAGLIIDFVSSHGVITNVLVFLGLERQNLLMNPNYFWAINLISDIWQGLGFGSIVFLASISNVNPELHEAAIIDGANRFMRAQHVTIPGIMPTIITILIMRLGLIMTVGFDKILLLYNPMIYITADVISTHVARMGIEQMQFGYSAAVGLFNSVVGTTLVLVSNIIARKYSESALM